MILRPVRCMSFRALTTALNVISEPSPASAKRIKEDNPSSHTAEHIGLFYTIPDSVRKELFSYGSLPKSFEANVNTFAETCIMIRAPALEVINFLKKTDFKGQRPVIRYLLYGKPGCGKSISLSHILHFAHLNGFYIFHIPWAWNWFRSNRHEVAYSTSREGLVDLPLVAAHWLKHFQSQNSSILNNKLEIHNDYVWNKREATPAGSPLSDLISHGINRVKYACDCVDAIVSEIKLASKENRCKAVVAVNGFNSFFAKRTNLKAEDRTKVMPDKVSLTQTFLSAAKNDWCNGAVILTVDQIGARPDKLRSHLPLYLLGKKGFEHIDPFIGVHVPEFTDLEFNSMLDYYEDRRWLQKIGGRPELSFVSNNNPYRLMRLCASL